MLWECCRHFPGMNGTGLPRAYGRGRDTAWPARRAAAAVCGGTASPSTITRALVKKTIIACVATALLVGSGTAVADSLITGADIKNRSVEGRDIANATVTEAQVKNETLNSKDLRNGHVLSEDIKNGDINVQDISKEALQAPARSG